MTEPNWPDELPTLTSVLDFLHRVSTPSLGACHFNIDFLPPVFGSYAYDESAYTTDDGQPYYAYVFGQVTRPVVSLKKWSILPLTVSGQTIDDLHLTFRIGIPPDSDHRVRDSFARQLVMLARPVKWDDDLDCDNGHVSCLFSIVLRCPMFFQDVRITPCTDSDRLSLSSGSWIDIHIAHAGAEFATVYAPSEGTNHLHRSVPTKYKTYPLREGDWVLFTATLHRRDDTVWDRRVRNHMLFCNCVVTSNSL
jgi:hypothetical protein